MSSKNLRFKLYGSLGQTSYFLSISANDNLSNNFRYPRLTFVYMVQRACLVVAIVFFCSPLSRKVDRSGWVPASHKVLFFSTPDVYGSCKHILRHILAKVW